MLSPFCFMTSLPGAAAAGESPATLESLQDTLFPAIRESLQSFGPELVVAVGALVILVLGLFLPGGRSRHLAWPAIAICLLPLPAIISSWSESGPLFLGMTALDPFACFFKAFFLVGTVPIIVLTYLSESLRGRNQGELYFLLLTAVLGAMLMASSTHFLMIFLSLEILSLSSYLLVGYVRSNVQGAEASLKYVIYGAFASAVMAYGFSLWFGLTGSGELGALATVSSSGEIAPGALQGTAVAVLFAFLCIFMGIAYKMSVVPMHFWAPDVYEGAPTPVTAFLSVVSKGAGFALALRFLGGLVSSIRGLQEGGALAGFWDGLEWPVVLMILSAMTMTLGNLAALWQSNLKRLLAYSSIAHAGYMMMGLALLRPDLEGAGMETIAFYLVAYLSMNYGAFAVVMILENRLGSVEVTRYGGLGRRFPFLALAFTVFLFSLIGIPPTAGFMGKFQLLLAVVGVGSELRAAGDAQCWSYYALVLVAVLNTALSAYYYLRIVKTMYFDPAPHGTRDAPSPRGVDFLLGRLLVAALVILTFYLCLEAGGLLDTTLDLRMHG